MATLQVTRENIHPLIDQGGIVILDFWASWCGPCKMFGPVFERVSEKHPDVKFGKVNTEAEQQLSGELGIRSIPTVMVFRDQVLLFEQAGALPEAALEELVSKVKALDMNQIRAEISKQEASK